jgi:hypothetical protein
MHCEQAMALKKIFNPDQMDVLSRVIAQIKDDYEKQIGPLVGRLAELEQRKGMTYAGVWRVDKAYEAGSVVVDQGASWHANTDTAGVRPGGPEKVWVLIAKGRARK